MPVAHHVLDHARRTATAPAVQTPARTCTWADLAQGVHHAAGRLRDGGTRRGDLVPVHTADPVELLTLTLAADVVGAVPLVCDPAWSPAQLAAALEVVGARAVDAPTTDAPPVEDPTPDDASPDAGEPCDADLAWAG
ncbi:AMP-binding protein, partial [Cellulomonas bogoriensis]|uniref:AMP-binding protein n=1 Tax=Cellulomonas bogoriensis TaxID=301388 RepID=UPI0005564348